MFINFYDRLLYAVIGKWPALNRSRYMYYNNYMAKQSVEVVSNLHIRDNLQILWLSYLMLICISSQKKILKRWLLVYPAAQVSRIFPTIVKVAHDLSQQFAINC